MHAYGILALGRQKYRWCRQDDGWDQWTDWEYEANTGGSLYTHWSCSWHWWGPFCLLHCCFLHPSSGNSWLPWDLSNCKSGSFWNTILIDLQFLQDELEAELEELEGAELEEQLLQPTTTPHMKLPPVQNYSPPAQVPVQRAPPQRNAEDDELAALQAEMAL